MGYPVKIDKERMVYAEITESISTKKGIELSRKLVKASRKFDVAKRILEELVNGKRTIDGKTYEKTAKGLLKLFNLVEANAKFRGFDTSNLFILSLSVNKGPTLHRGRRKSSFGSRMKISHLKLVVEKR